MELDRFYSELMRVEALITERGLDATVSADVHWVGTPLSIRVRASESFDAEGYWSNERRFEGEPDDAPRLIREAQTWVMSLPPAEDRAIEVMIRKLNEIVGKLPKGNTEVAQGAWSEIRKMILAKADQLAKNGLTSPARISEIRA